MSFQVVIVTIVAEPRVTSCRFTLFFFDKRLGSKAQVAAPRLSIGIVADAISQWQQVPQYMLCLLCLRENLNRSEFSKFSTALSLIDAK